MNEESTNPALGCLAEGPVERIIYSNVGDGVLVVGDALAERISVATVGSSLFGGEVQVVVDADLSLENMFAAGLSDTSPQVKARNYLSTGPSFVVVAFEDSANISLEGISRIVLLAGERRVVWVAPQGLSEGDFAARARLFAAAEGLPGLHIVASPLAVGYGMAANIGAPTFAEGTDVWAEVVSVFEGLTPQSIQVSEDCQSSVGVSTPGEQMRLRAIDFAQKVVGNPTSRYSFSTNTSPNLSPYPYNCSTLIAAAYRYATGDAVQLVGFSDSQLWDMENIELIPWSEVQPGDIFYQKTMDDRFLGHVGMVLEKGEFGGGTVIHSCGDDGWCANAPAYGMGYTDISRLGRSGGLAYPLNPALANTSRQGNIGFTSDYTQAWYGRVKVPSAS